MVLMFEMTATKTKAFIRFVSGNRYKDSTALCLTDFQWPTCFTNKCRFWKHLSVGVFAYQNELRVNQPVYTLYTYRKLFGKQLRYSLPGP